MNALFTSGSIKELWKMSFPMMITFFSMSAMLFVDRMYLSWYSPEALTAGVTAGTLSWAFICFILTIGAMSEVFVSQFNGAKKYQDLGKPVWQMLYLCLFSFIFFIPIAIIVAPIVFPYATMPLEYEYFRFFMFTGPFFCVHAVLAGFFIGRGFPKIIQWMAIISNLVNIILDPIFIFGIKGFFPSFGMMGAAYATLIGSLVQCIVVFLYFISKQHNSRYNTRDYRFDKKLFLASIKIGIPPAIFVTLELIGWTVFYIMMKGISQTHILVAGICQSILILFFFVGWGLEKGVVAIAGNFIGQGRPKLLTNIITSAFKIILIFAMIMSVILIIYPGPLIDWFFYSPAAGGEVHVNVTAINLAEIKSIVKTCLYFIFFCLILENVRWVLSGLLTAAGDTMFLLVAGTASLWIFCFLPIYFFVYLPKGPIVHAYIIEVVYHVLGTIIVYARFKQGKWKTINLIEGASTKPIEKIQSLLDPSTISSFSKTPTDSPP